jgi:hypothetical protein
MKPAGGARRERAGEVRHNMRGTLAWIDRPVETQGCAPASTSSLALAERVLNAELDEHFDSEAAESSKNRRNRSSKKTF